MRVVLVGPAGERARLRERIDAGLLEIVGEFVSVSAARNGGIDADAILLALDGLGHGDEVVEPLTSREIQVLDLLAQGLANKAIASRLGIGEQTVKSHIGSISGKLGASNRTDAVRRAARMGLITL